MGTWYEDCNICMIASCGLLGSDVEGIKYQIISSSLAGMFSQLGLEMQPSTTQSCRPERKKCNSHTEVHGIP